MDAVGADPFVHFYLTAFKGFILKEKFINGEEIVLRLDQTDPVQILRPDQLLIIESAFAAAAENQIAFKNRGEFKMSVL